MELAYLGKKSMKNLETTTAIIVAAMVLHNIAVQTRLVLSQDGREVLNDDNNLPNDQLQLRQRNEQGRWKC